MTRNIVLALLLAAASASVASAQTTMDLSTIDLGIQQIQSNTFLFESANRSMAATPSADRGGVRRPGPANTTGGGAGQPLAARTTFTPVADSIMPRRLGRQMGRTPEERERLEKFFALLLTDYKQMAVERGAPLNDVARASSFMVGTSYDVYYHGSPLGDKAFQAARRQMYAQLGASPKFQRLSDRERQEMYECYIILGQFVSAAYADAKAKGDAVLEAKMLKLARINLEGAFGVPLERLSFTDEGVRY